MSGETNEPSAREQRVNEAIATYLKAVDAGEAPDPKEFIAAHGDIAAELNSFFANRDEFERMAEPLQPAGDAAAQEAQHDDVTLPPADQPIEAPTIAPTIAPGKDDDAVIGTMVRYFGDYELVEEIARGGMGVVYKARQVSLNRIVALKMILAGQLASKEDIKRFYTEAEAAANLDHPGIVPIHEVGEHDGQHYFSMGFVQGESLADRLRDGPLPPREAAQYSRKIAEAIAFAHQQGVIHRDLKPANILLKERREPRVKSQEEDKKTHVTPYSSRRSTLDSRLRTDSQPMVTDFGLAKKTEADSNLTGTGQILGTPSYMPPEQAAGRVDDVMETADVYSLGAVLYALVTGRPPFQADNPLDTLMQVLEREPVPPSQLNPSVPKDLETICLKCLEKKRDDRFQSADDFVAELNRYLNGEPILSRPIGVPTRFYRWSKRHKILLALITSVVVVMIASVVLSLHFAYAQRKLANDRQDFLVEKERQRADAEAKAQENEKLREEAEAQLFDAMIEQSIAIRNEGQPGYRSKVLRLLERARDLRRDSAATNLIRQELLLTLGNPIGNAIEPVAAVAPSSPKPEPKHLEIIKERSKSNPRLVWSVSPDGRLLAVASGSRRKQISLYDAAGKLIGFTQSPAPDTHEIEISSDSTLMAVGAGEGVVVWRLPDLQTLSYVRGDVIRDVTFHPKYALLASLSLHKKIEIHDVDSQRILADWIDNKVRHITFSANGDSLLMANSDKTYSSWNLIQTPESMLFAGHSGAITGVRISDDGTTIASVSQDQTARIWNAQTGEEIHLLEGHQCKIEDLCMSEDGRYLVTGDDQGFVKLWDLISGNQLCETRSVGGVWSIRFSTKSNLLVAAGKGASVWRLEIVDGQHQLIRIHDFQAQGTLRDVAINPVTSEIAMFDGSNVYRADLDSKSVKKVFSEGQLGYPVLEFLPDGKKISMIFRNGQLGFLNWESGSTQRFKPAKISSTIQRLTIDREGTTGAFLQGPDQIALYDFTQGKIKYSLPPIAGPIWDADMTGDGANLVLGTAEGQVVLWRLNEIDSRLKELDALDDARPRERPAEAEKTPPSPPAQAPRAGDMAAKPEASRTIPIDQPSKKDGKHVQPEASVKVVIDASRAGGVWWTPQKSPEFDPEKPHQGKELADYLKNRGWQVREIERGEDVTDRLEDADIVIRFGSSRSHRHSSREVVAYQTFVQQGGTLLLLAGYRREDTQDPVADAFGIRFQQTIRDALIHAGRITRRRADWNLLILALVAL